MSGAPGAAVRPVRAGGMQEPSGMMRELAADGRLGRQLAALVLERGCVRLDRAVLEWHQPAIELDRRARATRSGGWHTGRPEGETLRRLAGGAPGGGGATSSTT